MGKVMKAEDIQCHTRYTTNREIILTNQEYPELYKIEPVGTEIVVVSRTEVEFNPSWQGFIVTFTEGYNDYHALIAAHLLEEIE